jgi:hypothetical protein
MKLTILESITVSRLFPNKGSYELIKATQLFKPIIAFNEDESRKYDIYAKSSDDGRQMVSFNKDASDGYLRELNFPPILAAHISKTLKEMSDKNELEEVFLSLYEKFVNMPVPIVSAPKQGLSKEEEAKLVRAKNGN